MLISTEIGAGEIISTHDDARFYDDVGCLAAEWPTHSRDATVFVRTSAGWQDAMSASFAQSATARTAMGSGFAAFSTAAEAKAADREGRALTRTDVVRLVEERR